MIKFVWGRLLVAPVLFSHCLPVFKVASYVIECLAGLFLNLLSFPHQPFGVVLFIRQSLAVTDAPLLSRSQSDVEFGLERPERDVECLLWRYKPGSPPFDVSQRTDPRQVAGVSESRAQAAASNFAAPHTHQRPDVLTKLCISSLSPRLECSQSVTRSSATQSLF